MLVREVRVFEDCFDRPQALTTTPGQNGWTIKDTSSAGTPTYLVATADGGGMVLTLVNTNEAEIVTMYHNDVLVFDLANIQLADFLVSVSGVDSVTTIVVGMASAQNDTDDTVSVAAWFRMQGSVSTSALVVETDDNTTNLDDKATGKTLSSTPKLCRIDFQNGLDDVRFYIDGEPVAVETTFDMSAVSSGQNVQPYVQIQKASGTGTPAITIKKVRIQYKVALGA